MIRIGRALTRLIGLCVLISLIVAGTALAAEPASAPKKWNCWWELGGYYGTDDSSRGEGVLWTPFWQGQSALVFTEIRGKFFEEDNQEVNFALGYRRMLTSGWNLGVWSGLDLRNSQIDNRFWQVSGGLEALSDRWDMRVNVYAPITDPKPSPSLARVSITGNRILMTGGEEVPLYGVDGEVGFKLFGGAGRGGFKDGPFPGRRHEVWVYGGGFWFDDDAAVEKIAGPRIRAEWRLYEIIPGLPGSRLTLEVEYSDDDVRGDKSEVGVRLRIPFGGSRARRANTYASLTAQERRMTEGLERDTDIVVGVSKAEPVVDALTGALFNRVASVDAGTNVQGTIDSAGQNSLIVAQGANGNINASATLQPNQTLMSGGTTIRVRGANSGTANTFTAPGSRATMVHIANSPAITMNNNTHLAGMNLAGAGAGGGNIGIFATNVSNVFVAGNRIDNFGGTGISLTNGRSGAYVVRQNVVLNAGADGIHVGGSGSGTLIVDISGNRIENSALDGIQVTNFNSTRMDLTMINNIVDGAGADAVRFDFQNDSSVSFVIASNRLSNAASDGLEFDIESNSVAVGSIYDNQIGPTTFGEGIEIDQDQSSNATMRIYNNTIASSFADPIDIDLDDDSVGRYQVYNNIFSSNQPASIIDIDTNDNAFLGLQVYANTSNVNFDFDEDGASTFEMEDTLNSNTLTGGAAFVIDPLIDIVPAGTYFLVP